VLAREGLGVLVVEREAIFRDRIRGEGIHPWGVAEAHRLGLQSVLGAAKANPLPTWQRYRDRIPEEPFHWADVSIDGQPELGVHHPRLQDAALSAAAAAGATVVRPAKVTAFRSGSNPEIEVVCSDRSQSVKARLVVGANGRTSAARRWAGGVSRHDPVHHRLGGGLFEGVTLASDVAHEAPFEGGRFFILPQGDGRVRAYVVTAPDRHIDAQRDLSGEAMLALLALGLPDGALVGATKAGPVGFFPNADTWASEIAGNGVVLIGDAAGANDPSVGHGLSLTFRDVRELRDLLLDGDDWAGAIRAFAARRQAYFEVLRRHAIWLGTLITEVGPEADERRERVARAREADPSAGGFALIFARGPDGLVADEAARRRFFGEGD
jgi:2-polyprenyl-6-methoxyphenol hydroxylase-like FAD-dependent oxidoreductase